MTFGIAAFLVGVSCGAESSDTSPSTVVEAPVTSTQATPSAASAEGTAAATASTFPVTIEHQYGETVVPAEPQRVVSAGFIDQDALLALGVVPVGIREWYGEQPSAVWPWATDELGTATPAVLASAELNFEQIAALEPDLIVGVSSGMTQQEYDALTAIAPTIAQSGDFIEFGMPWQDGTRMIGAAVGRAEEADQLIAETEALFEAAREQHPELQGATGVVGFALTADQIGGYGEQDVRGRLLSDLGMLIPAEIDELAGDRFYAEFSAEQIALLDRDVLVWIAADATAVELIRSSPLRQTLRAATEGREVFLDDPLLSGAASFSSVLSLPYLLDELVPRLAAAVDGDPATSTD